MRLRITALLLVIILLYSSYSFAITLTGNIYDTSFENIDNAVLIINTTPIQKKIIQNEYSLEIKPGNYLLTVEKSNNGNYLKATEEIIIPDDSEGLYTLDFILFPDISEDLSFIAEDPLEEELKIDEAYTKFYYQPLSIIIIIVWVISIYFILKALGNQKKKHEKEEKEIEKVVKNEISELKKEIKQNRKNQQIIIRSELEEYVKLIKKEEQILQKDFTKAFPISHAKGSLIISELEELKIIKKIKKGRGNIIVYQGK